MKQDEINRLIENNRFKDKLIDWLATYIGHYECVRGTPPTTVCPSQIACRNCWIAEARKRISLDDNA